MILLELKENTEKGTRARSTAGRPKFSAHARQRHFEPASGPCWSVRERGRQRHDDVMLTPAQPPAERFAVAPPLLCSPTRIVCTIDTTLRGLPNGTNLACGGARDATGDVHLRRRSSAGSETSNGEAREEEEEMSRGCRRLPSTRTWWWKIRWRSVVAGIGCGTSPEPRRERGGDGDLQLLSPIPCMRREPATRRF